MSYKRMYFLNNVLRSYVVPEILRHGYDAMDPSLLVNRSHTFV